MACAGDIPTLETLAAVSLLRAMAPDMVAQALARDYARTGRRDPPECVRPWLKSAVGASREVAAGSHARRQHRHAAGLTAEATRRDPSS